MRRVLNIVVSITVLGLLIWWADAGLILGYLRSASLGWLALAGLSLTVLTLLMAKRWQVVARFAGIEISYFHAVAEYYIAQLVNLVLPGGVMGDVARSVRVRHAGGMIRAAQSVAAERIAGQAVMFSVLGAALIVALMVPNGLEWPAFTWVGIGVGVAAGAGVYIGSRRKGGAGQFLSLIIRLLTDIRILVLSLIIAALLIFSLYACARATGTVIPPTGWFTLIPLILSSMLIPLSVAGWGWREGAAAALFPLIGAQPSAGIAMGIAYGAMMMIAALPGLYFVTRAAMSRAALPNREMETR